MCTVRFHSQTHANVAAQSDCVYNAYPVTAYVCRLQSQAVWMPIKNETCSQVQTYVFVLRCSNLFASWIVISSIMSMRARQLLARALSGAVDQSPYPGAPHSRFTPVLRAETPRSKPLPTFRAVASNGSALRICATGPVADAPLATDNTLLCNVLRGMIKLRCLDTLCLQAHRQGRIPFYAPSTGEEVCLGDM